MYDYDLLVIGGGSGGLAASKAAAHLGARVACLDCVSPSPAGSTWGLGGTCVNVGCIPKKLMHTAGLHGENLAQAESLGWRFHVGGHSWPAMVAAVQSHIASLNRGYESQLRDARVTYLNARGRFVGPHELACTDANGAVSHITAARVIIAVGGRPKYLEVPGAVDCCLTSDDLFALPASPGRTLVVGASYIAMECAGFLTALGLDVTMMARSIFLRGFDQEIASHLADNMARHGTRIVRPCVPTAFARESAGGVRVVYDELGDNGRSIAQHIEVFDTVVLAVGRDAATGGLGLEAAGLSVAASGKIPAVREQTVVPHIYAIGDVLEGRQELTPVAIQAGKLLAQRLFGGGTAFVDYEAVPTTVFTPLEYGCVGLSEEEAISRYGADAIEVYASRFAPLEWATSPELGPDCMAKLVVNLADSERVVGLHYCGPHAGEVVQGFAVALRLRATKADLDSTIGIHPTCAEVFTTLEVTKRSGAAVEKSGC